MEWIILLLSGGVGGIIGGTGLKKYSMGLPTNLIAGAVGGVISGQLLGGTIGDGSVAQIIAGAGGGILVQVIAGVLKSLTAK